jgi:hypothetical protein
MVDCILTVLCVFDRVPWQDQKRTQDWRWTRLYLWNMSTTALIEEYSLSSFPSCFIPWIYKGKLWDKGGKLLDWRARSGEYSISSSKCPRLIAGKHWSLRPKIIFYRATFWKQKHNDLVPSLLSWPNITHPEVPSNTSEIYTGGEVKYQRCSSPVVQYGDT